MSYPTHENIPGIIMLAGKMSESMERRTRDNGDTFTTLKDDAPEWVSDVIHAAHGNMMPDDFRYSTCEAVADHLASLDDDTTPDQLDDMAHEWADGHVDVYNGRLAEWMASHLSRGGYVDDAVSEYGWPEERGVYGAIAMGQFQEIREIWDSILSSLADAADDLGPLDDADAA